MSDKPTAEQIGIQVAISQRNVEADRTLNALVELNLAKQKIAELEARIAELEAPKQGEVDL